LELAKAMSALETTVRVSPEKQTLILAGEAAPRRDLADPRRPLTVVATPVEETRLLVHGTDRPVSSALVTLRSAITASHSAADAYVRTSALSLRARSSLIDIYA
jgi:predicted acylesterase/phospholipase RssA